MMKQLSMPVLAKNGCAAGLMQRLALPVMAISMLAGCAATAPKQQAQPVAAKPAAVVAPEVRADFDAAMARMNAQEYQKGIELLDKVVAQIPNNPVPYVNRAMAQEKLGK